MVANEVWTFIIVRSGGKYKGAVKDRGGGGGNLLLKNLFMKIQFSILILSGSCIIFDLKKSGSMSLTFFKMNQSQNAIFWIWICDCKYKSNEYVTQIGYDSLLSKF